MTLRTTSNLKCECGHEGTLSSAENDQPYSIPWVRHDLNGFSGTIADWQLDRLRCPSCGQEGRVEYVEEP